MGAIKRNIGFIRGDSHNYKMRIKMADGKFYVPEDTDNVYLTIKDTPNSPVALQKYYPDGGITFDEETAYFTIAFEPSDTEEMACKEYYYDIELHQNIGGLTKTLMKGSFNLYTEITTTGDYI